MRSYHPFYHCSLILSQNFCTPCYYHIFIIITIIFIIIIIIIIIISIITRARNDELPVRRSAHPDNGKKDEEITSDHTTTGVAREISAKLLVKNLERNSNFMIER